jgi:hypothetical protein
MHIHRAGKSRAGKAPPVVPSLQCKLQSRFFESLLIHIRGAGEA